MTSLPGKWIGFLKMSESQLQKRRIGLEAWLVDVLSVRVVYNAQPVELFLQREGASANSFSTSTSKQIELPGFFLSFFSHKFQLELQMTPFIRFLGKQLLVVDWRTP